MPEEWTVRLPGDVSDELSELPENRVKSVVSNALREALDLAESAEDRREELHERVGIESQDSEELAEDSPEPGTEVEKRQAELREKIRGGR